MTLEEIKKEYNHWIVREKKAEQFMESDIDTKEKEKWLPEYFKITENLSMLILKYEEITKTKMPKYNIFNGFKLE